MNYSIFDMEQFTSNVRIPRGSWDIVDYEDMIKRAKRAVEVESINIIKQYEEQVKKQEFQSGKEEVLKMFSGFSLLQFLYWKGDRILNKLLNKKILKIAKKR